MPKLVRPGIKYKKSFLEDFLKRSEMQDDYQWTGIAKKDVPRLFGKFIYRLNSQSKKYFLPKGFVPQTVLWLVAGKKFIGKASIRHRLNPFLRKLGGHIGYYIRPEERQKGYGKIILNLTLKKAKVLGIKNVVITCDITNIGSKKIIEANGGKLEAKVNQGKNLPSKLRYKISTK